MTLVDQFLGFAPEPMDAFVGATALDQFKLDRGGLTIEEYWTATLCLDGFPVLVGNGLTPAFLIGGLYLLYRRIITWHIPVAVLGAIGMLALVFYDGGSSASHGSPFFHLFGGAAMFGAFFIATDPVSGPATNQAKLIYGLLIGILIYSYSHLGSLS